MQHALLLSCDWQLDARTSLWLRETGGRGHVSRQFLSAFQRHLRSLKRLSGGLDVSRNRTVSEGVENR